MNEELILTQMTDDEGNEYLAYTLDIDGEYLTHLTLDGKLIGIFKHISCHDRFYCDSLYGDFDTNAEFAERIDTIFMEEAEKE